MFFLFISNSDLLNVGRRDHIHRQGAGDSKIYTLLLNQTSWRLLSLFSVEHVLPCLLSSCSFISQDFPKEWGFSLHCIFSEFCLGAYPADKIALTGLRGDLIPYLFPTLEDIFKSFLCAHGSFGSFHLSEGIYFLLRYKLAAHEPESWHTLIDFFSGISPSVASTFRDF